MDLDRSAAFLDFVGLVREQAMGLRVCSPGCIPIWCVREAEDLPLTLVHPKLQEPHSILVLHLKVLGVSFCDVRELDPFQAAVHVDVSRHDNAVATKLEKTNGTNSAKRLPVA